MNLSGLDETDVKESVIEICRSSLTFEGIYFNVQVSAVASETFHLLRAL